MLLTSPKGSDKAAPFTLGVPDPGVGVPEAVPAPAPAPSRRLLPYPDVAATVERSSRAPLELSGTLLSIFRRVLLRDALAAEEAASGARGTPCA